MIGNQSWYCHERRAGARSRTARFTSRMHSRSSRDDFLVNRFPLIRSLFPLSAILCPPPFFYLFYLPLSFSLSFFPDTFLTQAQFYFLRRTPSVSPCEADLAENRVSLYNQIHRTCVTRDCNMCNRNYRPIFGIYYGISYKYAARALLATYIYIYFPSNLKPTFL